MKTRNKADYAAIVAGYAYGQTSTAAEETLLLLGKDAGDLWDDADAVRPILFQQAVLRELVAIRQLLTRLCEQ